MQPAAGPGCLYNKLFDQYLPFIMSDEECAFDNWEDAAEEQITAVEVQEPPKEKQQPQQQQPREQERPAPAIAKATLKDRIAAIKQMTDEQFEIQAFEGLSAANQGVNKLATHEIMKSDKDFVGFANKVVERLGRDAGEEPLDDDCLATFVEELAIYLYRGMEWKNLLEVGKKLKIAKNERKTEEKKISKLKEKEKRQKKNEELEPTVKIEDKQAQKDELFGGAGMNSKQEEQERKNRKAAEKESEKPAEQPKVEEAPKPAEEEDDDDFM